MQFSFTRTGHLLRKQWVENQKLYLLGILAMVGIMAGAFFFYAEINNGLTELDQRGILALGMMGFGAIFTSAVLSQHNSKSKSIQALMLPSSATEKLAMAIVYSLLLFPVIYILAVYPVVLLVHYIDKEFLGNLTVLYHITLGKNEKGIIIIFTLLQSFVLFCSVIFRQFTFVKTVILVCIIFFGIQYFNPLIAENTPKNDTKTVILYQRFHDKDRHIYRVVRLKDRIAFSFFSASPFSGTSYITSDSRKYIVKTELPFNQQIWFGMFFLGIVPFCWLIAWFKLRETQL